MNRNRKDAELVVAEYVDPERPPLAMYDLGVGINSEYLTLKELYPDMALFGCEPNPVEFAALALSPFDGRLANVAISGRPGKANLSVRELGSGGSSLFVREGDPVTEVETWTLDEFDYWAGRPDRVLLWMDIEGSELAALQGGTDLLRSGRVKWVSVEVYDEPPRLPDYPSSYAIRYALGMYGYRKVREYNHQGAHYDCIYTLGGARLL